MTGSGVRGAPPVVDIAAAVEVRLRERLGARPACRASWRSPAPLRAAGWPTSSAARRESWKWIVSSIACSRIDTPTDTREHAGTGGPAPSQYSRGSSSMLAALPAKSPRQATFSSHFRPLRRNPAPSVSARQTQRDRALDQVRRPRPPAARACRHRAPAARAPRTTSGRPVEAHQVLAQHHRRRSTAMRSCTQPAQAPVVLHRALVLVVARVGHFEGAQRRRAGASELRANGARRRRKRRDELPLVDADRRSGAAARSSRRSTPRPGPRAAPGARSGAPCPTTARGRCAATSRSASSSPQVDVGEDHQLGDQLVERRAALARHDRAPCASRRGSM